MIFAATNLHIAGTMTGSRKDTDEALAFAKRGELKDICEVRPLSRLPESIKQLRKGLVAGRIVIDFNLE